MVSGATASETPAVVTKPGVPWSPTTASEGRPRGTWSRLGPTWEASWAMSSGPPPGGSEASRIGCGASFFPLPFLRRRSYRHSRNNCGNSRSGLVWSGLVWSAIFLRSVAFFSARGGSLADRPGAVTTWLVSSPFSGACQTRPHWRHQALNQTRPQRPSTAAAATKIATSRRRATDDDEGCFSHFRS